MARSFHKDNYVSQDDPKSDQTETVRPKGSLIWGHATRAEHVPPLLELAERLRGQNPDCTLLLSAVDDAFDTGSSESLGAIKTALPSDNATSVDAFLDLWQPDYVIWTAGNLRASIVDRTTRRNIPMSLVAAESSLLTTSSWRWLKGLSRSLLTRFDCVFAIDAASLRDLGNLKLETVDVTLGGPFMESAISLPYNEAERAEMTGLLLGRPIWLAAHVDEKELTILLEAHRRVMRFSHRAMLILVPEPNADQNAFLEELEKSGLTTIRWSDGEPPSEATQIVFADIEGELGLWYRLAPISFMGSSLFPGMTGSNPYEPAAHGSAIVHGPHLGRLANSYARFSDASAAKRVTDADSLAAAITRLIQPDQCASMAHTAWEVASRGSTLTDTIAERILDHIDQVGPRG